MLERSLRFGGSKSCGCLRAERASAKIEHKLDGRTFGELKVKNRAESKHTNGGTRWLCECSCGNVCEVPATLLVKGRKTHCGCKTIKKVSYSNITGQEFGRLTAVRPIERRSNNGGVVWLCECSCGNTCEVPYNGLMYSNVQSCGCLRKELDLEMPEAITRVDGTSIDHLRSKKIPTSNTTGARGVYRIKGKWLAKIVFQGRQFHLGTYDSFEEARQVREEVEKELFDVVVEHYEKWESKAALEHSWAEANPVSIIVTKTDTSTLDVRCLPEMP